MKGEKCGRAGISEKTAKEIKERLSRGGSIVVIARDYGVRKSLVDNIKRGKSWSWL